MSVPECLARTLLPGTVWPVHLEVSGKMVFATGIEINHAGEWLISYQDPFDPKHYHIRWILPSEEQRKARIVP